MYDHYFTASDVNIYLRSPETNNQLHIDKAIGIGYSHSMSTAPIYVLGNVDPAFFSRGNSIVQGNLDIAFKSTKYLQVAIQELLGKKSLTAEKDRLLNKARQGSGNSLSEEEWKRLSYLQSIVITDMKSISISDIFSLFEIVISYNNSNSNMDGKQSGIVLEGVKIQSQSMGIHSQEESSLVDRITFLAKNVREL